MICQLISVDQQSKMLRLSDANQYRGTMQNGDKRTMQNGDNGQYLHCCKLAYRHNIPRIFCWQHWDKIFPDIFQESNILPAALGQVGVQTKYSWNILPAALGQGRLFGSSGRHLTGFQLVCSATNCTPFWLPKYFHKYPPISGQY